MYVNVDPISGFYLEQKCPRLLRLEFDGAQIEVFALNTQSFERELNPRPIAFSYLGTRKVHDVLSRTSVQGLDWQPFKDLPAYIREFDATHPAKSIHSYPHTLCVRAGQTCLPPTGSESAPASWGISSTGPVRGTQMPGRWQYSCNSPQMRRTELGMHNEEVPAATTTTTMVTGSWHWSQIGSSMKGLEIWRTL
ncbi:hypothetical protein M8J76_011374 [Diaphorina citri]|nr:hypothetical protein M8J76_011374 [Diaphorina citri]